jgi:hypothetical protein
MSGEFLWIESGASSMRFDDLCNAAIGKPGVL